MTAITVLAVTVTLLPAVGAPAGGSGDTVETSAPAMVPTTPTSGMSDSDDAPVPGFGVLAALAALLTVCALVVRRR